MLWGERSESLRRLSRVTSVAVESHKRPVRRSAKACGFVIEGSLKAYMAVSALLNQEATHPTAMTAVVDRATLTLFLTEIAESVGADFYMLLTIATRERRTVGRVIAANWVFDAVELVSADTFGALASGSLVALPGNRPEVCVTAAPPKAPPLIEPTAATLLSRLGHAEIYSLRLHVGRNAYCLILSGTIAGTIDADSLGEAQMRCNYALSAMPTELRAVILKNILTERERECLAWAAEGKTSEEIALILDVHTNAANGAITSAMEKLHARNRVEAVATAIRIGIL